MKAPMHHRAHLVVQLRELGGGETLVEPGAIELEIELRLADQEVGRSEPAKGRQPGAARLEIARKCIDVRRLGSNDAPAEDPDPFACFHRPRIVLVCVVREPSSVIREVPPRRMTDDG